jgi:zinc transporter ZupT
VASAFVVDRKVGLLVFVAILLHKLPEGFTAASIMLASGRAASSALAATLVIGAATLAGVLSVAALQAHVAEAVVYALPFSAGVTLYVAASDLIPEVNHLEEKNPLVSLIVFAGVALFYAFHLLVEW